MTPADQLETFRLNCPLDNKYLKQVVDMGSNEVLSLELYCPPILLDSHLSVVRTYIRELKLNLKARKVNSETIEIISAATVGDNSVPSEKAAAK